MMMVGNWYVNMSSPDMESVLPGRHLANAGYDSDKDKYVRGQ
jgi:hypothetical protein